MRRAAAALLALCVLLISSGCSKQADGGTLRFDLARAPETIDPQFAASGSSLMVVVNAFEGLTRRTPAGEIQPACAERWDVSPDGKTYTFTLREGLQWADGSPLLAEDFVFAFRR
ncbi:MAG: ABC transporter substrate-binding protein, partial [Oscillospiraceae bacterium]